MNLAVSNALSSTKSKSMVNLGMTAVEIKDCHSGRPLNHSSDDLTRIQSNSSSQLSDETVVSESTWKPVTSTAGPPLLQVSAPDESHNNTAQPTSLVVARPPSCPPPEDSFYFLDLDYFNPTSPHKVSERHYGERYVLPKDTKEIEFFEPDRSNTWQRTVIEGWSEKQTPEGQTYFYHAATRIYTFAWMFDPAIGQRVDGVIVHLDHYLKKHRESGDIPEDTDAVFDLCYPNGVETWMYYLTSQSKREVFWLTQVHISLITDYLIPVFDKHHIKDALESLYWLHVRMFPNYDRLPDELWEETQMWLDYFAFDGTLSLTSTAPFNREDARDLAVRVREMRAWRTHSTAIFTIASILQRIAWARFMNFSGQRYVRVDRDHTIFESAKPPKCSRPFRMISLLLFFWPDVYIQKIDQMWVDNTVNVHIWTHFFERLQEDWKNCITPAAVVLSANVGLLAIQSLDTGAPTRSLAQVASYVSTLLSMGNIVTCTILSRQHRTHSHTRDANDAASFLGRRAGSRTQIELLAVSFSLPAAFFMWGILTFLVAMSFVCFHDTSVATRVSVGILLVVVAVPTLYLSMAEWVVNPSEWLHLWKLPQLNPLRTLRNLVGQRKGPAAESPC